MPENFKQRELRARFFDIISAQESLEELLDIEELRKNASSEQNEVLIQRRAARSVVRFARLRDAYEAGRLEAVLTAISYCHLFEYIPPAWLVQATNDLLLGAITSQHRRRVHGEQLHLRRWQLVTYSRGEDSCSIERAIARASAAAAGSAIGGSEATFWRSYNVIQRALKRGEDSRFHAY